MPIEGVHRHRNQGKVISNIKRPSPCTVEAFSETYSAFILDHLGKLSVMHRIRPLSPSMVVCGPAVTSLGPDLTVRRMAIDLSQPGDVLVVAAGGDSDTACFGDGTAKRMQLKGMAGAIIDGATRDARYIRQLGFPTFVLGVTPKNYHYPVAAEYGGVNVPVVCAGVLVYPGDLIFGDDDGVVVVPRADADAVVNKLITNLRLERQSRAAMVAYEPFNVSEEMRRRGYQFE